MSALKVRTAVGPDVWTTVGTGTTGVLKVRTATGPDVWEVAGTDGILNVRTAVGPDVWSPVGDVAGSVVLLEDDWTGTDGAAWNSTKWAITGTSASNTIQSNRGQITVLGAQAISVIDVTDFDLVVKISSGSALAAQFPEIGWRIGANLTIGSNPDDGYVIQVQTSDGGRVRLMILDTYSVIATAAATELNAVVTAWFRIRVEGTSHKIRWWLDGASEPGTWQIEATDATYATGRVMLRTYSDNDVFFDDLTVIEV